MLIDEWVAFVRQLYGVSGLPAGSFDANLTFAQALTESARAVPNTLVVASLPSSDIEIGGEGGREALARLKNTFSRMESAWRPASAEEGFEIVRRRLFQPITDPQLYAARDAVVRGFSDLYRGQPQEFPSSCREADYERRLQAAYPIHPELFDRLYNDWSSLDKFQRTRGVLRLMAAVIHALWMRHDASLMILPASVPIDEPPVQFELTRYMEDPWVPVIEKDVDGPTSLPLAPGPGEPQPRPLLGLPPRGADALPRLGPDAPHGQQGAGGSQHPPRLRPAGRDRGDVRRRPAPADRRGDPPLRRWQALLVLDPAQRHPPGPGPRRTA